MNLEHAQHVLRHLEQKRQEQTMTASSRIALIDLSGLFYRCWHAGADRPLGFAFEETLGLVRKFTEGFEYVAICCDAPPYWRKDLHPEYKAQRDKPEPQALEQLRRVEGRLAQDGYCIWKCDGYEADDVIATAVRIAVDQGLEVVIGSSDKDMLQLVSDRDGVSAISIASGVRYNDAAVQEKFGVGPGKMRDWLALVGDKSDNVPGVPGVGPKNAAALLAEFGTAGGVLAGCDRIKRDAIRESVFKSGDAVRLALELVKLKDDAPINFAEALLPRQPKPLHDVEEDEMSEEDTSAQENLSERQTEPPSATDVETEAVELPQQKPSPVTAITKTNGSTSMVTEPASTFDAGLQPGTLEAAWKFAGHIANSRLYPRLPNREAVFIVIVRGRELGLGAITALDSIHYYEGKIAFGAHLLIARAMRHPDCEYFRFLGGDHTFAEYETKNRRNEKPTRLRYTIEQAERAGLLKVNPGKGPGPWIKRPDEMLRKTTAMQLARIEYPEALLGAYAQEELEGAA